MTQDDDKQPGNPDEQQTDYAANPFEKTKRQQPTFNDFEEDEDIPYEEPDRDTDNTSGFLEDSLEDDEFDDYLPEEDELDDDELPDSRLSAELEPETSSTWQQPQMTAADPSETWLEEEEYPAEDVPVDGQPWPLALIAVGALALVLLIAGGYGVIQQRSATQEEIRQLQAALATAASPEDVNASRATVRELKRENARLASQTDALRTENRRLLDTVAGLEAQLDAQRAAKGGATPKPAVAAAKPVASKTPEPVAAKPAAPKPRPKAATPAPKVAQTPASASGVTWFVNFGSYGQRSAAEAWKTRLKPGSGKVIIAPSSKDGKTFYRVRVINLTSRESADKVARSLEKEYDLSKLWVGKQ